MHSNPGINDSLGNWLARGAELQKIGRHAEALDALAQALAAEPGHPVAHLLAGISNLHLGRWETGTAHARAAAAGDPRNAAAWCNLALGQRELGRKREAQWAAKRAIEADPHLANGWIALGLVEQDDGRMDAARKSFLHALELDPNLANVHLSLANLHQDEGNTALALESYRRAQALDATIAEVPYSRAHLFHKVTGDIPAAIASYREAIAIRGDYAMAHHNLANALFLAGDFADAWEEYRWRPPRLRFEARCIASGRPYDPPREIPPKGSRLLILAEQGLGDVVFFLRFAKHVRERGVALELGVDPRLHGMLSRTGLFERMLPADEDLRDASVPMVLAGDLPSMLPESERGNAPPPLALTPDPARLDAARSRLASLGPPPHIALAWRAGTPKTGAEETLLKQLPLPEFGAALKGVRATWISLQRDPKPGETEALAAAVGAPVHDLSAVNEDLEDCLAFMAATGEFVGVSNTNVHLRAACGLGGHVLVPFPHEWRWMSAGPSRWFPKMQVHRQSAEGSWAEALERLGGGIRPKP